MDEEKRKEIWDSFLEAYKKLVDENEFLRMQIQVGPIGEEEENGES